MSFVAAATCHALTHAASGALLSAADNGWPTTTGAHPSGSHHSALSMSLTQGTSSVGGSPWLGSRVISPRSAPLAASA
eukprot:4482631-Pleurochrysis_carterae.AAC.3